MTDLAGQIRAKLPSVLRTEAAHAIEAVLDLHKPFTVWDDCGHAHDYNEDWTVPEGLTDVNDVGLVCEDGVSYVICRHCCCGDSDYQDESCVSAHGIEFHDPCPTVRVIVEQLGLTAEVEK